MKFLLRSLFCSSIFLFSAISPAFGQVTSNPFIDAPLIISLEPADTVTQQDYELTRKAFCRYLLTLIENTLWSIEALESENSRDDTAIRLNRKHMQDYLYLAALAGC